MPAEERVEKLTIENFAGIKHLEMEVRPFTVLIGPQSVGKSVAAKVLYFFKSLPWTISNAAARDEPTECEQAVVKRFGELFYDEVSANMNFAVTWSSATQWKFEFRQENGVAVVSLPDDIRKAYKRLAESDQFVVEGNEAGEIERKSLSGIEAEMAYWRTIGKINLGGEIGIGFIPAGRSFYAQIERDAASFFTSAQIDPFVAEFGKLLAQLKKHVFWQGKADKAVSSLVTKLLGGSYIRENNQDFILSADGRRLPSSIWSSGQQEACPLALMLQNYHAGSFATGTLLIEEPEAHLYPSSQRVMTELIALAFNARQPGMRFFLTTHSPYILTTIDNLLEAGQLYTKGITAERKAELSRILPEDRALAPGSVGAFYMDQNGCRSIMDEETGLIGTSEIDEISGQLNEQFDALLNEAVKS